jgi:TonB family protein
VGRALIFILTTGLMVSCGASSISRENADLVVDFEDMVDYDSPPVLIRAVRPDYPEMARQVGVEGRVVLKVLVLEDGYVGAVQILESPSTVLTDHAITALRQSVFAPATKEGQPCCATTVIPFVFGPDDVWIRTRAGLESDQAGEPPDKTPAVERPDSPGQDIKPKK